MDINFENLQDLHVTLSTAFQGGLVASPATEWSRIATRMGSSSSHNRYPFLGELTSMREWLGERIFKQLASHDYSVSNRLFELSMDALITDIQDDQGGLAPLLGSRAEIMGRSVALHPDELVMGEGLVSGDSKLCYDGQFFFDTDHPMGSTTIANDMAGSGTAWYLFCTRRPLKPLIYQVREAPQFQAITDLASPDVFKQHKIFWGCHSRDAYGYGFWQSAIKSKQTLNETNLLAAIARMESFENDEGRNFGLTPDLLVVPRSLKFTAKKMLESEYLSVTGGSTENNFVRNAVDLMVSNYI